MNAKKLEFELKPNERMIIHRTRLKMTLQEMGLYLGMSRRRYQMMEQGVLPFETDLVLDDITQAEYCRILRLRNRLSQKDVARALGLSPLWVLRMEAGKENCDRLVEYWSK